MINKILALSLVLLVSYGCGYEAIKNHNSIAIGGIKFSESIPSSIKIKLKDIKIDESEDLFLLVDNYGIKERKTYGGSALRALEGELKGEMTIILLKDNKRIVEKLVSIKNYNVTELNPLAEKETVKKLEERIQKDLVQQIIFEIQMHEM